MLYEKLRVGQVVLAMTLVWAGCGGGTESGSYDLGYQAGYQKAEEDLKGDLDDVKASVSELETQLTELAESMPQNGGSYLTSDDLAGYVTETQLEEKGYLNEADVSEYLMQAEALDDYLTTADAASTYATQASLADYATLAALEDYATLAALEEAVQELSGVDLSGLVTNTELATTLTGYVQSTELSSYLTKTEAGNVYATQDALDDYLTEAAANSTYAKQSDLPDVSGYMTEADAEGKFVGLIDADLTITVDDSGGADHTNLPGALAFLGGKRINTDAVVTISIASGIYENNEPIHIRHPDGDRIRIMGQNLNTVQITHDADGPALIVEGGSSLGLLANLKIDASPEANTPSIVVRDGGALNIGRSGEGGAGGVEIHGAHTGLQVENGASVSGGDLAVYSALHDAVDVLGGSSATLESLYVEIANKALVVGDASYAQINSVDANEVAVGVHVYRGSAFRSEDVVVFDAAGDAIDVDYNSVAWITGGSISEPGLRGAIVMHNSYAHLANMSIANAQASGVWVSTMSSARLKNLTITNPADNGVGISFNSVADTGNVSVTGEGGVNVFKHSVGTNIEK